LTHRNLQDRSEVKGHKLASVDNNGVALIAYVAVVRFVGRIEFAADKAETVGATERVSRGRCRDLGAFGLYAICVRMAMVVSHNTAKSDV
jgi:hypothetical protein